MGKRERLAAAHRGAGGRGAGLVGMAVDWEGLREAQRERVYQLWNINL